MRFKILILVILYVHYAIGQFLDIEDAAQASNPDPTPKRDGYYPIFPYPGRMENGANSHETESKPKQQSILTDSPKIKPNPNPPNIQKKLTVENGESGNPGRKGKEIVDPPPLVNHGASYKNIPSVQNLKPGNNPTGRFLKISIKNPGFDQPQKIGFKPRKNNGFYPQPNFGFYPRKNLGFRQPQNSGIYAPSFGYPPVQILGVPPTKKFAFRAEENIPEKPNLEIPSKPLKNPGENSPKNPGKYPPINLVVTTPKNIESGGSLSLVSITTNEPKNLEVDPSKNPKESNSTPSSPENESLIPNTIAEIIPSPNPGKTTLESPLQRTPEDTTPKPVDDTLKPSKNTDTSESLLRIDLKEVTKPSKNVGSVESPLRIYPQSLDDILKKGSNKTTLETPPKIATQTPQPALEDTPKPSENSGDVITRISDSKLDPSKPAEGPSKPIESPSKPLEDPINPSKNSGKIESSEPALTYKEDNNTFSINPRFQSDNSTEEQKKLTSKIVDMKIGQKASKDKSDILSKLPTPPPILSKIQRRTFGFGEKNGQNDHKLELERMPRISQGKNQNSQPERIPKISQGESQTNDRKSEPERMPKISQGENQNTQPERIPKISQEESQTSDRQSESDRKPKISQGVNQNSIPKPENIPKISQDESQTSDKFKVDRIPRISQGEAFINSENSGDEQEITTTPGITETPEMSTESTEKSAEDSEKPRANFDEKTGKDKSGEKSEIKPSLEKTVDSDDEGKKMEKSTAVDMIKIPETSTQTVEINPDDDEKSGNSQFFLIAKIESLSITEESSASSGDKLGQKPGKLAIIGTTTAKNISIEAGDTKQSFNSDEKASNGLSLRKPEIESLPIPEKTSPVTGDEKLTKIDIVKTSEASKNTTEKKPENPSTNSGEKAGSDQSLQKKVESSPGTEKSTTVDKLDDHKTKIDRTKIPEISTEVINEMSKNSSANSDNKTGSRQPRVKPEIEAPPLFKTLGNRRSFLSNSGDKPGNHQNRRISRLNKQKSSGTTRGRESSRIAPKPSANSKTGSSRTLLKSEIEVPPLFQKNGRSQISSSNFSGQLGADKKLKTSRRVTTPGDFVANKKTGQTLASNSRQPRLKPEIEPPLLTRNDRKSTTNLGNRSGTSRRVGHVQIPQASIRAPDGKEKSRSIQNPSASFGNNQSRLKLDIEAPQLIGKSRRGQKGGNKPGNNQKLLPGAVINIPKLSTGAIITKEKPGNIQIPAVNFRKTGNGPSLQKPDIEAPPLRKIGSNQKPTVNKPGSDGKPKTSPQLGKNDIPKPSTQTPMTNESPKNPEIPSASLVNKAGDNQSRVVPNIEALPQRNTQNLSLNSANKVDGIKKVEIPENSLKNSNDKSGKKDGNDQMTSLDINDFITSSTKIPGITIQKTLANSGEMEPEPDLKLTFNLPIGGKFPQIITISLDNKDKKKVPQIIINLEENPRENSTEDETKTGNSLKGTIKIGNSLREITVAGNYLGDDDENSLEATRKAKKSLEVPTGESLVGKTKAGSPLEETAKAGISLEGTTKAGASLEGTAKPGASLEGTAKTGASLEGPTKARTSLEGTAKAVTSLEETTKAETSLGETVKTETSLEKPVKIVNGALGVSTKPTAFLGESPKAESSSKETKRASRQKRSPRLVANFRIPSDRTRQSLKQPTGFYLPERKLATGYYPPARKDVHRFYLPGKHQASGIYPSGRKQESGFYPPARKQESGFYPSARIQESGFYPPTRRQESGYYPPPRKQESGLYPTARRQDVGYYPPARNQENNFYHPRKQESDFYPPKRKQQVGYYPPVRDQKIGFYPPARRQTIDPYPPAIKTVQTFYHPVRKEVEGFYSPAKIETNSHHLPPEHLVNDLLLKYEPIQEPFKILAELPRPPSLVPFGSESFFQPSGKKEGFYPYPLRTVQTNSPTTKTLSESPKNLADNVTTAQPSMETIQKLNDETTEIPEISPTLPAKEVARSIVEEVLKISQNEELGKSLIAQINNGTLPDFQQIHDLVKANEGDKPKEKKPKVELPPLEQTPMLLENLGEEQLKILGDSVGDEAKLSIDNGPEVSKSEASPTETSLSVSHLMTNEALLPTNTEASLPITTEASSPIMTEASSPITTAASLPIANEASFPIAREASLQISGGKYPPTAKKESLSMPSQKSFPIATEELLQNSREDPISNSNEDYLQNTTEESLPVVNEAFRPITTETSLQITTESFFPATTEASPSSITKRASPIPEATSPDQFVPFVSSPIESTSPTPVKISGLISTESPASSTPTLFLSTILENPKPLTSDPTTTPNTLFLSPILSKPETKPSNIFIPLTAEKTSSQHDQNEKNLADATQKGILDDIFDQNLDQKNDGKLDGLIIYDVDKEEEFLGVEDVDEDEVQKLIIKDENILDDGKEDDEESLEVEDVGSGNDDDDDEDDEDFLEVEDIDEDEVQKLILHNQKGFRIPDVDYHLINLAKINTRHKRQLDNSVKSLEKEPEIGTIPSGQKEKISKVVSRKKRQLSQNSGNSKTVASFSISNQKTSSPILEQKRQLNVQPEFVINPDNPFFSKLLQAEFIGGDKNSSLPKQPEFVPLNHGQNVHQKKPEFIINPQNPFFSKNFQEEYKKAIPQYVINPQNPFLQNLPLNPKRDKIQTRRSGFINPTNKNAQIRQNKLGIKNNPENPSIPKANPGINPENPFFLNPNFHLEPIKEQPVINPVNPFFKDQKFFQKPVQINPNVASQNKPKLGLNPENPFLQKPGSQIEPIKSKSENSFFQNPGIQSDVNKPKLPTNSGNQFKASVISPSNLFFQNPGIQSEAIKPKPEINPEIPYFQNPGIQPETIKPKLPTNSGNQFQTSVINPSNPFFLNPNFQLEPINPKPVINPQNPFLQNLGQKNGFLNSSSKPEELIDPRRNLGKNTSQRQKFITETKNENSFVQNRNVQKVESDQNSKSEDVDTKLIPVPELIKVDQKVQQRFDQKVEENTRNLGVVISPENLGGNKPKFTVNPENPFFHINGSRIYFLLVKSKPGVDQNLNPNQNVPKSATIINNEKPKFVINPENPFFQKIDGSQLQTPPIRPKPSVDQNLNPNQNVPKSATVNNEKPKFVINPENPFFQKIDGIQLQTPPIRPKPGDDQNQSPNKNIPSNQTPKFVIKPENPFLQTRSKSVEVPKGSLGKTNSPNNAPRKRRSTSDKDQKVEIRYKIPVDENQNRFERQLPVNTFLIEDSIPEMSRISDNFRNFIKNPKGDDIHLFGSINRENNPKIIGFNNEGQDFGNNPIFFKKTGQDLDGQKLFVSFEKTGQQSFGSNNPPGFKFPSDDKLDSLQIFGTGSKNLAGNGRGDNSQNRSKNSDDDKLDSILISAFKDGNPQNFGGNGRGDNRQNSGLNRPGNNPQNIIQNGRDDNQNIGSNGKGNNQQNLGSQGRVSNAQSFGSTGRVNAQNLGTNGSLNKSKNYPQNPTSNRGVNHPESYTSNGGGNHPQILAFNRGTNNPLTNRFVHLYTSNFGQTRNDSPKYSSNHQTSQNNRGSEQNNRGSGQTNPNSAKSSNPYISKIFNNGIHIVLDNNKNPNNPTKQLSDQGVVIVLDEMSKNARTESLDQRVASTSTVTKISSRSDPLLKALLDQGFRITLNPGVVKNIVQKSLLRELVEEGVKIELSLPKEEAKNGEGRIDIVTNLGRNSGEAEIHPNIQNPSFGEKVEVDKNPGQDSERPNLDSNPLLKDLLDLGIRIDFGHLNDAQRQSNPMLKELIDQGVGVVDNSKKQFLLGDTETQEAIQIALNDARIRGEFQGEPQIRNDKHGSPKNNPRGYQQSPNVFLSSKNGGERKDEKPFVSNRQNPLLQELLDLGISLVLDDPQKSPQKNPKQDLTIRELFSQGYQKDSLKTEPQSDFTIRELLNEGYKIDNEPKPKGGQKGIWVFGEENEAKYVKGSYGKDDKLDSIDFDSENRKNPQGLFTELLDQGITLVETEKLNGQKRDESQKNSERLFVSPENSGNDETTKLDDEDDQMCEELIDLRGIDDDPKKCVEDPISNAQNEILANIWPVKRNTEKNKNSQPVNRQKRNMEEMEESSPKLVKNTRELINFHDFESFGQKVRTRPHDFGENVQKGTPRFSEPLFEHARIGNQFQERFRSLEHENQHQKFDHFNRRHESNFGQNSAFAPHQNQESSHRHDFAQNSASSSHLNQESLRRGNFHHESNFGQNSAFASHQESLRKENSHHVASNHRQEATDFRSQDFDRRFGQKSEVDHGQKFVTRGKSKHVTSNHHEEATNFRSEGFDRSQGFDSHRSQGFDSHRSQGFDSHRNQGFDFHRGQESRGKTKHLASNHQESSHFKSGHQNSALESHHNHEAVNRGKSKHISSNHHLEATNFGSQGFDQSQNFRFESHGSQKSRDHLNHHQQEFGHNSAQNSDLNSDHPNEMFLLFSNLLDAPLLLVATQDLSDEKTEEVDSRIDLRFKTGKSIETTSPKLVGSSQFVSTPTEFGSRQKQGFRSELAENLASRQNLVSSEQLASRLVSSDKLASSQRLTSTHNQASTSKSSEKLASSQNLASKQNLASTQKQTTHTNLEHQRFTSRPNLEIPELVPKVTKLEEVITPNEIHEKTQVFERKPIINVSFGTNIDSGITFGRETETTSGRETISGISSGRETISRTSSERKTNSGVFSGRDTSSDISSGRGTSSAILSGRQTISGTSSGRKTISGISPNRQTLSGELSQKETTSGASSNRGTAFGLNSHREATSGVSSTASEVSSHRGAAFGASSHREATFGGSSTASDVFSHRTTIFGASSHKEASSGISTRKENAFEASSRKQTDFGSSSITTTASDASSRKKTASRLSTRKQTASELSSRKDTASELSSRHQTASEASSKKQTASELSSRHQTASELSSRKHITSEISSGRDAVFRKESVSKITSNQQTVSSTSTPETVEITPPSLLSPTIASFTIVPEIVQKVSDEVGQKVNHKTTHATAHNVAQKVVQMVTEKVGQKLSNEMNEKKIEMAQQVARIVAKKVSQDQRKLKETHQFEQKVAQQSSERRLQEVEQRRSQEFGVSHETNQEILGQRRIQEAGQRRIQEAGQRRIQEAGQSRIQEAGQRRIQEVGQRRIQEAVQSRFQDASQGSTEEVVSENVFQKLNQEEVLLQESALVLDELNKRIQSPNSPDDTVPVAPPTGTSEASSSNPQTGTDPTKIEIDIPDEETLRTTDPEGYIRLLQEKEVRRNQEAQLKHLKLLSAAYHYAFLTQRNALRDAQREAQKEAQKEEKETMDQIKTIQQNSGRRISAGVGSFENTGEGKQKVSIIRGPVEVVSSRGKHTKRPTGNASSRRPIANSVSPPGKPVESDSLRGRPLVSSSERPTVAVSSSGRHIESSGRPAETVFSTGRPSGVVSSTGRSIETFAFGRKTIETTGRPIQNLPPTGKPQRVSSTEQSIPTIPPTRRPGQRIPPVRKPVRTDQTDSEETVPPARRPIKKVPPTRKPIQTVQPNRNPTIPLTGRPVQTIAPNAPKNQEFLGGDRRHPQDFEEVTSTPTSRPKYTPVRSRGKVRFNKENLEQELSYRPKRSAERKYSPVKNRGTVKYNKENLGQELMYRPRSERERTEYVPETVKINKESPKETPKRQRVPQVNNRQKRQSGRNIFPRRDGRFQFNRQKNERQNLLHTLTFKGKNVVDDTVVQNEAQATQQDSVVTTLEENLKNVDGNLRILSDRLRSFEGPKLEEKVTNGKIQKFGGGIASRFGTGEDEVETGMGEILMSDKIEEENREMEKNIQGILEENQGIQKEKQRNDEESRGNDKERQGNDKERQGNDKEMGENQKEMTRIEKEMAGNQGIEKDTLESEKKTQGIDKENVEINKENKGIVKENQGINKENQSINKENERINKENERMNKENPKKTKEMGQNEKEIVAANDGLKNDFKEHRVVKITEILDVAEIENSEAKKNGNVRPNFLRDTKLRKISSPIILGEKRMNKIEKMDTPERPNILGLRRNKQERPKTLDEKKNKEEKMEDLEVKSDIDVHKTEISNDRTIKMLNPVERKIKIDRQKLVVRTNRGYRRYQMKKADVESMMNAENTNSVTVKPLKMLLVRRNRGKTVYNKKEKDFTMELDRAVVSQEQNIEENEPEHITMQSFEPQRTKLTSRRKNTSTTTPIPPTPSPIQPTSTTPPETSSPSPVSTTTTRSRIRTRPGLRYSPRPGPSRIITTTEPSEKTISSTESTTSTVGTGKPSVVTFRTRRIPLPKTEVTSTTQNPSELTTQRRGLIYNRFLRKKLQNTGN